jgi:hypothetical protein
LEGNAPRDRREQQADAQPQATGDLLNQAAAGVNRRIFEDWVDRYGSWEDFLAAHGMPNTADPKE